MEEQPPADRHTNNTTAGKTEDQGAADKTPKETSHTSAVSFARRHSPAAPSDGG